MSPGKVDAASRNFSTSSWFDGINLSIRHGRNARITTLS